jgi:hypothetical protein
MEEAGHWNRELKQRSWSGLVCGRASAAKLISSRGSATVEVSRDTAAIAASRGSAAVEVNRGSAAASANIISFLRRKFHHVGLDNAVRVVSEDVSCSAAFFCLLQQGSIGLDIALCITCVLGLGSHALGSHALGLNTRKSLTEPHGKQVICLHRPKIGNA